MPQKSLISHSAIWRQPQNCHKLINLQEGKRTCSVAKLIKGTNELICN